MKTMDAFHLPQILGNFGRKSNRKVRFGSVRRNIWEVVDFDRSDWSSSPTLQLSCFSQMQGTGENMQNGQDRSARLARFNRIGKCRSIFLTVGPC